jgi:ankyrin repeat protein
MAVLRHNMECVRLLVEYGADINVLNDTLCTPLHLASELNQVECVKFLLEHSADSELKNSIGKTPIECCNNETIKELIKSYTLSDIKEPDQNNFVI